MSQEEMRFDVVHETVPADEEENRYLAIVKARSLHIGWRSRFTEGEAGQPVKRPYQSPSQDWEVDSANDDQVRVTVTRPDSSSTVYDFDGQTGTLQVAGDQPAAGTPELLLLEEFSRLLFDADRAEYRG